MEYREDLSGDWSTHMADFGDEVRRLLAERGMSLRELARRSHYHVSYLSNVCNGRKPPTAQMAAELDELLGAGGKLTAPVTDESARANRAPGATAPVTTPLPVNPDTGPDRRSVLAGSVMAGHVLASWLAPIDPERLARAARHQPQVDMPVVISLREMLVAQRHIEDSMGTVAVREPVLAQLATIENLVRQARGPVRPALLDVAQGWAQFAAYLHRDAGDPAGDRARLAQALEWATEIGDKTMIATVFVNRGNMALNAGDIGTVIGLAQAAQRDRTVDVGQLADGAGLEAQGCVMAGDAAAAERKLGEMTELAEKLTDRRQDQHPPWLYWMSYKYFLCHQGLAFSYLADKPRYREQAVTALQTGYAALPDDQKSSAWAARFLVHLANVHARAGDLDQSHDVLLQAAAIAQRTGSVRLAEMLAHVLARLHSRWPGDPRVAELDEALR